MSSLASACYFPFRKWTLNRDSISEQLMCPPSLKQSSFISFKIYFTRIRSVGFRITWLLEIDKIWEVGLNEVRFDGSSCWASIRVIQGFIPLVHSPDDKSSYFTDNFNDWPITTRINQCTWPIILNIWPSIILTETNHSDRSSRIFNRRPWNANSKQGPLKIAVR